MRRFRLTPLLRFPVPSYLSSFICTGFITILLIFCISLNFNSSHRDNSIPSLPPDAELMIPQILNHITWSEGENVLDYGCGNGAVGYYLIFPHVKEHNGHQYALEYARANYLRAQKSFPDERLTYAQGNLLDNDSAKNFPFKGVTFDKIFAIYVFHMIHNLEELLSRYREILKQDGVLGFTTLTENNFCFQLATRMSQQEKWKKYLKNYQTTFHPSWSKVIREEDGENKLRKMFSEAGFKVKFLKIEKQAFDSYSVDKLLDDMLWLVPVYENVPTSLIPDLKQEFRRQFTLMTGVPSTAKHFQLDNEYIMGVLEKN